MPFNEILCNLFPNKKSEKVDRLVKKSLFDLPSELRQIQL
jgi:hypothetical protein